MHSLGVRSIPTQYTKYIQQHWRLHMLLDPPVLKQLHLTKMNTFQTQTMYWNPQRPCWTKSIRTSVQDAYGPQRLPVCCTTKSMVKPKGLQSSCQEYFCLWPPGQLLLHVSVNQKQDCSCCLLGGNPQNAQKSNVMGSVEWLHQSEE